MYQTMSFPLSMQVLHEWGGWKQLRRDVRALGLDGIEGITGDDAPSEVPEGLIVGYHLAFYPDWLDFYRGDRAALRNKFGSLEQAWRFYGHREGPEGLLSLYRQDMERARSLGAKYVVFHVSDVSIEEGYTYRWLHSDEEVIDTAAELLNILLDGAPPDFELLLENQWWPGFTFTVPEKTARLLDAVRYEPTGIMLDTGHLMNTNPALRTQAEGAAYIRELLRRHGALSGRIRGIHLHQSLSGPYVRTHTGFLPPDLPKDYIERFGASYSHILSIDQHAPWSEPEIRDVIAEIAPEYLTHELTVGGPKARLRVIRQQMDTLRNGGRPL